VLRYIRAAKRTNDSSAGGARGLRRDVALPNPLVGSGAILDYYLGGTLLERFA